MNDTHRIQRVTIENIKLSKIEIQIEERPEHKRRSHSVQIEKLTLPRNLNLSRPKPYLHISSG